MNPRRHQNDTKTFAELTFEEQARAMNMSALQFRKQLNAHLRRADQEGRPRREVLKTRLNLLRSILDAYAGQDIESTISIRFTGSSEPETPPSTAVIVEPMTDQGGDTFMCSQCHMRRSIKEANMDSEGLSFICDSCYLSNPPMGDVDSTLDEIT